jgi:HEAT repeat protein
VPCLRRAVTFVPEWDDDGQLARKAVWALDRIGTPEALDAIREEVTDDLPFKVVEAAEEALAKR